MVLIKLEFGQINHGFVGHGFLPFIYIYNNHVVVYVTQLHPT